MSSIDSLLVTIVDKIKAIFGSSLVSVVLYGSYARGDFDVDSDIDIMAIIDLPVSDITQYNTAIDILASKLSLETDACTTISISLQDSMTLSKYGTTLPFFSNVLSEGVTLYAAR